MIDYRKVLGDNVRAARAELGVSQEELGLDTGIDRTYISGIERGKRNPSLKVIVEIAEQLMTTPGELLNQAEQD